MVDRPEQPERPTGNVGRWMERKWGWPEGSLMGMADIAELLGVTRQRVSQLQRNEPTFPRSSLHAYTVDFWGRAGIQAWVAMHRPGQAEAAGRFAGEAAELLLAAERVAKKGGYWWVDATSAWAAVCRGAAGAALAATLDGLGMTIEEMDGMLEAMRGTGTREHRRLSMNPRIQRHLASADRRAEKEGREHVTAVDILLAFVDAPRRRDPSGRLRPGDNNLDMFERRGLDIDELRGRLLAVEADPSAVASFDQRRLRRMPRRRSLLPGVDLMPNPFGHDPRTRTAWGSTGARTRDERGLVVNGEQWFFAVDGDGFYVRAADGRPIGYRWRIRPKPRKGPVNARLEVLPMPPVELADWPDRRFSGDD